MTLKIAQKDGVAQLDGEPLDVYEVLGVLLSTHTIDRITLCVSKVQGERANAGLCWALAK